MSLDCPPTELLLRLSEPDLFDDPAEAREVAERAEGCPDCQAILTQLEVELTPPPLPFDPQELLPELRARLAERATPAPVTEVEVRLRCGYCKDGLQTRDALYCASCLTPHHAECYSEHGRCVAAGCSGQAVVGARQAPTTPPRPRRLWSAALGVLALSAVGGVAAFGPQALIPQVAEGAARPSAPAKASSPDAPPAPAADPVAPAPSYTSRSYAVGDLVKSFEAPRPAWEERYRRRLVSQRVSLNFAEASLGDVVGFLRDITGLNLTLGQGLDLTQRVSLRLREASLESALDLIAEQCAIRWSLIHGTVYLQPVLAGHLSSEPVSWPLAEEAPPAQGAELLEALRSETLAALGPEGWREPARAEVRGARLQVTQSAAGHAAVEAFLAGRRLPPPPPSLRGAWFAPAPPREVPPALTQARLYAHELLGQVSLSVEGSAHDALEFLRGITKTPIRVAPGALPQVKETKVQLSLRDVTRRDALNLICASVLGLVWEVDRRGVLLRPAQAPPLETRLRRAAQRAFDLNTSGDLRRALDGFKFTLTEEPKTGAEVIDFMRDVSGFNFVAVRAARSRLAQASAFSCRDLPLSRALEELLTPLGLGTDLSQGVIRIVPLEQASEGQGHLARRQALLQRVVAPSELRGLDLYALATQIQETCRADVYLDPSLLGGRERTFLRAGSTLEETLRELERQAGLESGLAWLPSSESSQGRFVLALRRGSKTDLRDALTLVAKPCPWEAPPPPVARAWAESQTLLLASLERLAEAEGQTLPTRLEAALAQTRATLELHGCYLMLGSEQGQSSRRYLAKVTDAVLKQRLEKAVALRKAELLQRARRRETQVLLRDLAVRVERGALDPAEAKREREALEREARSRFKDYALEIARLESTRRLLEQRLEAMCLLPGWVERDAAERARLASGEPYASVFPEGFSAARKRERETDLLRLRLGEPLVRRAEGSDEGASLLDPSGVILRGERVLSLGGMPTLTRGALIEAAGAALATVAPGAKAEVVIIVQRGPVQVPLTLELTRPQE